MTHFKALCQYVSRKTVSRSHTKTDNFITLLSEISCMLEAPVRLGEFKSMYLKNPQILSTWSCGT